MNTQILMNVDYSGNNQYWSESAFTNKIVTIDTSKNIHNQIAELLKDNDSCELSYKNKPKGNIFIDTIEGEPKIIGYIYRGKQEIFNDLKRAWIKCNFDVWVSIKKISEFNFEPIN